MLTIGRIISGTLPNIFQLVLVGFTLFGTVFMISWLKDENTPGPDSCEMSIVVTSLVPFASIVLAIFLLCVFGMYVCVKETYLDCTVRRQQRGGK